VGKKIGEGDIKTAKYFYKHLLITALLIYTCEITFLLQFNRQILQIFTGSHEIT